MAKAFDECYNQLTSRQQRLSRAYSNNRYSEWQNNQKSKLRIIERLTAGIVIWTSFSNRGLIRKQ